MRLETLDAACRQTCCDPENQEIRPENMNYPIKSSMIRPWTSVRRKSRPAKR
jgi:hypothetical protein